MGGWREAAELSTDVLDGALEHLGSLIDTSGDSRAVSVFNPSSWPRTDVVPSRSTFATMSASSTARARRCRSSSTPEHLVHREDVPAIGYRTYRLAAGDDTSSADAAGWRARWPRDRERDVRGARRSGPRWDARESDRQADRQGDRRAGAAANELLEYREYPNHPLFGEDRGT